MSRERVERVLRGYEAFNSGDLEAALEGFPDDLKWEVPEILPDTGPFYGKEGVRRFWEMWRETFDDFRIEIEEVTDLDEHVMVMMRVRGRGRDSGIEVTTPSFPQLWTWRGDEIVQVRMLQDRATALEAVGAAEDASNRPERDR